MTLAEHLEASSVELTPEEMSVARTYVETLQEAGISSVAQVTEAANDARVALDMRDMSCRLLAWLGARDAAPALAEALENSDDDFAWAAANALVRLRVKETAPTLVRVLEQSSASKQAAAAWVLGWLGVASTIPSLRAAAIDSRLAIDVRAHSTEALGVMQAREAVPDLIAMLSSELPELRYWAAYSLGQIGDPASISALERLASIEVAVLPNERSVRQEALDALDAIRGRDAGGS